MTVNPTTVQIWDSSCDKIHGDDRITPGTMRFINWWKERCSEMLEASPCKRKKMVKDIEALDEEMHSRYDKLHGQDGPRPPSGLLNALGLKSRISYGNRLRKNRNITPRTMRFINWWKDRCAEMLQASTFKRKKMADEIEVLDDEMQSRYDKLHGQDGLCFALIEIFNVIAVLRMKAEYGDYLAYTCNALKGEGMGDMVWKVEELDWQKVGARIRAEEESRREGETRRLPPLPTPYLDDVAKAARRLGYEESLVGYQILAYAECNNFVHSGIKSMAENGLFQDLGERILEDLRSLEVIFQDRPHDQIEMRGIIKIVQNEWFRKLWIKNIGKEKRIILILTEKGNKNLMSLAPADS